MIIADYPYGRLGNQLQLAAHLITYAMLENRIVCLQYLQKYSDNFPYFDKSPIMMFPENKRKGEYFEFLLLKIIPKLKRMNLIKEVDFLNKNEWIFFDTKNQIESEELRKLKKYCICTIKVWRLRSTVMINQYRSLIKTVFTPKKEILEQGNRFIKSLECDIVIGVHIRWGDYKTAAPELYHDISIFKKRMHEANKLFPGKRVGYIVCTEEKQELLELNEFNCIFPKGDAITDLYTLAQTNYLIASASTFSEWAAYWGNIGIFRVEDAMNTIKKLDDFLPVELIVKI